MTEIALIAVGAISEALAFSLGILVGLQIAKERHGLKCPAMVRLISMRMIQ